MTAGQAEARGLVVSFQSGWGVPEGKGLLGDDRRVRVCARCSCPTRRSDTSCLIGSAWIPEWISGSWNPWLDSWSASGGWSGPSKSAEMTLPESRRRRMG